MGLHISLNKRSKIYRGLALFLRDSMENWCIVPCAPEIKKVLDRCKYGYFHVYRKVRQLIRLKKMPPLFWTPKSVELIPIDYTLRCPVHIPDLIKTIKLNQKIRWN